ncbi:MAG: hypothetical protein ACYTEO_14150 [Planctomycetota bacterium]|jgi:hypothetical protein
MVLEFGVDQYVDTNSIIALTPRKVYITSGVLNVTQGEFNIILKAWDRQWRHAIYHINDKGQLKKKTGELGTPKPGAYHPDFKKGEK